MNIALVLSGGKGSRVGSEIPKQYIKAGDKTVLWFCLKTLLESKYIDKVQIVAHKEWRSEIEKELVTGGIDIGKLSGFSEPGENRQLSILHGLEDILEYAGDLNDTVLIHDAARPLLSDELIRSCFEALKGHDGVMPALPMKDTVYRSVDGRGVSELLDRGSIFAGQAPELFRLVKYYEANKKLLPDTILRMNGSTEPAISAGMDVVMIPGDEMNFKVTTKEDLNRFREIITNGR